MLYFIPAWYQEKSWHENEQSWYIRRMRSEFDETVKHIQLFHRNTDTPYRVLLLSFSPNLRHFLHRQSMFHAPYWSAFDTICQIKRKKVVVFSFYQINWPEGTEFIYSLFAAIAMLNGEKYAQIEFGEDGNPIQIDMFQNGAIIRRNIYDDRGFISCTILYKDGKPVYQDYLMENGTWKLRSFFGDGHVLVNPRCPKYSFEKDGMEVEKEFAKLEYVNMQEVIAEVFRTYVGMAEENDIFCSAIHKQHSEVLRDVLGEHKSIITFFENRVPWEEISAYGDLLNRANYIISDSEENSAYIQAALGRKIDKLTCISPYDTRVDYGISQQLKVQKIMVPVDGLPDIRFKEIVQVLAEYLASNENARVYFFTRIADFNRKKMLLQKVKVFLTAAGFSPNLVENEEEQPQSAREVLLSGEKPIQPKFFAEQCIDELSINHCMREQRLLVDLRDTTAVYLQITAVSMGIPQILMRKSSFVEHEKNGYILQNIEDLPDVLDYYLNGLGHWNEAMICAYEIGKRFTTENLLNSWKEVISKLEQD